MAAVPVSTSGLGADAFSAPSDASSRRVTSASVASARNGRVWPLVVAAVLFAFLVLPPSEQGPASLQGWSDQSLFLRGVVELQTAGSSDLTSGGRVGPGYLGIARILSHVSGLEAGPALILLTRMSFAALLLAVLSAALIRRGSQLVANLPTLALVGAVCLATPWRLLSDIPWTHPLAAALVLAAVLALRWWPARPLPAAGLLGFSVAFLIQTRAFEGRALLVAVAVAVAASAIPWWRRRRIIPPFGRPAAALLAGAVSGWTMVGLSSGHWGLFRQYTRPEEQATLALDFAQAPAKAVQLFVDPCFRSICGPFDYQPQGVAPASLSEYWQQPLLMQLPFLALTAVVAISALLVLLARRHWPPLDALVALVAAALLIVGYTASIAAGGPHLRYGFVRDFIAPAALLCYSAARLGLLAHQSWRRHGFSALPMAGALSLVVLATLPGFVLPRVGPHLVDYQLSSSSTCAAGISVGCTLEVEGRDESGRVHGLNGNTIVRVTCAGQVPASLVVGAEMPREVLRHIDECESTGASVSIGYLPVMAGFSHTPEGEQLLASHLLLTQRHGN